MINKGKTIFFEKTNSQWDFLRDKKEERGDEIILH